MNIARTLPALALGLWTLLSQAEDLEPLDADFLEYLASLEDEDGDWTEVADDPPPKASGPCTASGTGECGQDGKKEDAAQAAAKKR